jgi:hypothetical protein
VRECVGVSRQTTRRRRRPSGRVRVRRWTATQASERERERERGGREREEDGKRKWVNGGHESKQSDREWRKRSTMCARLLWEKMMERVELSEGGGGEGRGCKHKGE